MATSSLKNEVLRRAWRRVVACLGLGATLMAISHPAGSNAQTKAEERTADSPMIRCVIRAERSAWKPSLPAFVMGRIEYLRDGASELKVVPELYLSSKTSSARYWGPVDLFLDPPLAVDMQSLGPGVSIQPRPISLKFKNKGDTIEFRIDAGNVLWDREISSNWPSRRLFNVVEPGAYDLQLVMDGNQSNQLAIVIAPKESQKQKPQ